ncbi:hypothetical protein BH23CHL2_BH23CHL2_09190 [soil metagenome]
MQYPDQVDVQSSRQLALQVDGLPLRGGARAVYTLQAVLTGLDAEERRKLTQLKDAIGPEIGVIDSHFDDTPLLLGQLGFRSRKIAGEDLGESDLRVIAISCPHRHTRLDRVDAIRHLERGGVLLSSDRAIRLPGIAAFLGSKPGRPAARARLSGIDGRDNPENSPVWLDSGHLPIDPSTLASCRATTLAENALTGEPLVVHVRSGNGGILHSVPHWLQAPHPELLTSVERRPLRDVPRFRSIGNSYPGLRLGGFLAQWSMVNLLIQGLAAAIDLKESAKRPGLERGK